MNTGNDRWQVIKDGVPVAVCGTIQEAERYYLDFDADEIRRIKSEEEKHECRESVSS